MSCTVSRTITLVAVALCVSFATGAWAAVTLNGAGATFPQPLYNKWFYDFNRQTGARVNYQGIGSGGGIKAIQSRTVDFAGSDAPMTNAELATMPAPVVQIPMVGGAVAIAYNLPGYRGGLALSPTALVGIYVGSIRRWDDPAIRATNPGKALPRTAITVVHRSDSSGTSFIFTGYLSSASSVWKSRVGTGKSVKWPTGEGAKGNPGVAGLVKNIPGAVGYMEHAFALQNRIPTAALRNKSGRFVQPSLAGVTASIQACLGALKHDNRVPIVNAGGARVYPICGLTYLIIYQRQADKAKGGTLVRMLNWCMSSGQKSAPSLQYAPLPGDLVGLNKGLIGRIK